MIGSFPDWIEALIALAATIVAALAGFYGGRAGLKEEMAQLRLDVNIRVNTFRNTMNDKINFVRTDLTQKTEGADVPISFAKTLQQRVSETSKEFDKSLKKIGGYESDAIKVKDRLDTAFEKVTAIEEQLDNTLKNTTNYQEKLLRLQAVYDEVALEQRRLESSLKRLQAEKGARLVQIIEGMEELVGKDSDSNSAAQIEKMLVTLSAFTREGNTVRVNGKIEADAFLLPINLGAIETLRSNGKPVGGRLRLTSTDDRFTYLAVASDTEIEISRNDKEKTIPNLRLRYRKSKDDPVEADRQYVQY